MLTSKIISRLFPEHQWVTDDEYMTRVCETCGKAQQFDATWAFRLAAWTTVNKGEARKHIAAKQRESLTSIQHSTKP